MEINKTLANIRKDIENHVGEKVRLKANGGRKILPLMIFNKGGHIIYAHMKV